MSDRQFLSVSDSLNNTLKSLFATTEYLRITFNSRLELIEADGFSPSSISTRKWQHIQPFVALVQSQHAPFFSDPLDVSVMRKDMVTVSSVRGSKTYISVLTNEGSGKSKKALFSFVEISNKAIDVFLFEKTWIFRKVFDRYRDLFESLPSIVTKKDLKTRLDAVFSYMLRVPFIEGASLHVPGVFSDPFSFEKWKYPPPISLVSEFRNKIENGVGKGRVTITSPTAILRDNKLKALRVVAEPVPMFKGGFHYLAFTGSAIESEMEQFVLESSRFFDLLFERMRTREYVQSNRESIANLLSNLEAEVTEFIENPSAKGGFTIANGYEGPTVESGLISSVRNEELETDSIKLCREALEKNSLISREYLGEDGDRRIAFFDPSKYVLGEPRKVVRLVHILPRDDREHLGNINTLNRIVTKVADGLAVIDNDLVLQFYDKGAEELLGISKNTDTESGNLISDYLVPIVGWKSVLSWAKLSPNGKFQGVFSEKQEFEFEKDTSVYKVVCTPFFYGGRERYLVLFMDISSWKSKIESLRRSRLVLDRIPDGVIYLDEEMRVTEFNAGASSMLGFTARHRGMKIDETLSFSSLQGENVNALFEKVSQQGVVNIRGKVTIPSLISKDVFCRLSRFTTSYGVNSGYVLVLSDETEISRQVKRIEFSSRLTQKVNSLSAIEGSIAPLLEFIRSELKLKKLALSRLRGEDNGAQVYPSDTQVFMRPLVSGNSSLLSKIFLGEDILFGAAATSEYKKIINPSETSEKSPEWVVKLSHDGGLYGILMIWESRTSREDSCLNINLVKVISSVLTCFLASISRIERIEAQKDTALFALDSLPQCAVVFEKNGTIRLANAAFKKVFCSRSGANILFDEVLCPRAKLAEVGIFSHEFSTAEVEGCESAFLDGAKGRYDWKLNSFKVSSDSQELILALGEFCPTSSSSQDDSQNQSNEVQAEEDAGKKVDAEQIPVVRAEERIRSEKALFAVIDDDIYSAEVIAAMLRLVGFECREFSEVDRFTKFVLANKDRLSCVVLDFKLGGVLGTDVLRSLEKAGYDKPSYLLTGFTGLDLSEFECDTLIDSIDKPVSINELRKRFRMFLSAPK